MNFFLATLLFLIATQVKASENPPSACRPIAVEGEMLTLATKEPSLVMIKNLSSGDLWVTHPVSNPGVSAGWSSRLQAGHWSALALADKSFLIGCIESKPGHEQQIPCAGVISACRWSKVSLPETEGTYWAGEDLRLSALIAHLGGRGFKLPALGR